MINIYTEEIGYEIESLKRSRESHNWKYIHTLKHLVDYILFTFMLRVHVEPGPREGRFTFVAKSFGDPENIQKIDWAKNSYTERQAWDQGVGSLLQWIGYSKPDSYGKISKATEVWIEHFGKFDRTRLELLKTYLSSQSSARIPIKFEGHLLQRDFADELVKYLEYKLSPTDPYLANTVVIIDDVT